MGQCVLLGGILSPELLWPGVSVFEKMLRPIVVYIFLVILLRVFGKRELAQLNPFDLVVLLSLSNTVQNAIIGNDTSLTGGLIGAFTLCGVNYVVVRFLFQHRRLDQLLEGKPTVLIDGGVVRYEALAHELLTEPELLSMAHRQGFRTVEEIQSCVLEPNGTFFIEGKAPPITERRHQELLDRLILLEKLLNARLGTELSAGDRAIGHTHSPTGDRDGNEVRGAE
jgi:uncharacterized membrane protein YcaP (DUF421 family)